MIVPAHNLPPESQRWGDAIDETTISNRAVLSSLYDDIDSRFRGVQLSVESLAKQAGSLEEYATSVPITRIDFSQASGWLVPNAWGTKVQVVVPHPGYPCTANVFAAAQGHIRDTANPGVVFQAACRISIGASTSPEALALLTGVNAVDEHWGLAITHASIIPNLPGSVTINFDVYNGSTGGGTPVERDATLGVITTFARL